MSEWTVKRFAFKVSAHLHSRPHPMRHFFTRILYVHNSADIYGASRSLVRLLRMLDRARFEPLVLLPADGPLAVLLREMGVKVILFPALSVITREVFRSWRLPFFALNIPFSALHLWRILRREKIGLVHTNTGVILSSGPAAWLAGVPHVWHIRDWFQEFRSFWRIHDAWMRFFSDRIVAVSEPIAGQFSDRAKVCVVNNGFDIEEFALKDAGAGATFREKYALGGGPVVGCVGRIKLQRKGQEVLMRAAGLLKQRGVRAKWLVVGAPYPGNESHLDALHEIVREGGIGDDVVFTGELADPRPAYAAMSVFVLPSAQPEPFGGVVMEAMCMAVPVIATNIGGSVEQVADGETGCLVAPGDPAALAEKLEFLLRDETVRARFGAAGRRRIAERFTLPGMVEKIVRIYDDCLGRGPVRILYVNNSADIYGASRCMVRLLERMDRTRFQGVVMLPEHGPLEPLLHRAGIEVIFFPQLSVITRGVFRTWKLIPFLLRLPLSIFALWRILKKHRIDLVHTNTGVVLSSGPAARLAGVPNVWHVRDWFQEFSFFWKAYSRYMHVFSDRIVAVSRPIAEQFPGSFGVTVVHDGFELEEFALADPDAGAKFRAAYALGPAPVVGCVGRIKLVRKGQEVLLRAAALLKTRGVRAKWLIVGAPLPGNESHLDALHEIVREAGLGEDVIFTGELPDPRPAYAAMDIFVLPSAQPEPFGGVVMEAMCVALPVIATNIGGSIQQVVKGETGYLIPPGDPAALAEKLELLLGDAPLRARLGEAGRRRIAERFTLNGMVEETVRVYEECLTHA